MVGPDLVPVPSAQLMQVPEAGDPTVGPTDHFENLATLTRDLASFVMPYQFAIREITTKLEILRDEFAYVHDYNPIEHVESRVKSPTSIVEKARRRGCPMDLEAIKHQIRDVAGVRVVCSFEADVYSVFDILSRQTDVTVVEVEDYISEPKPNGYRSLHAIVQIPDFLSSGPQIIDVELQMRTVAMDFWATLEHKIYYKYDRSVPEGLLAELHNAAITAAELDNHMQRLHHEIKGLPA
ncbi:MAG: GTP pyrophosphokinase family protein [Microthrixaceae bacterium]|nr:GTP pyrophosphokinase family protein [Microthrixaceae bacterium]